MTRRELLAMAAAPQQVGYRNYSRCLPDYLRDLAARAHETRKRALSKLTTPAAIRERQLWTREAFWKLAGGMPERTPLNARTVATVERRGYRLEKIVYESVPQFHIPANLYIPTAGKPPYPGVLFQMGHSPNGKAYDSYQRCCQALVQLGYLVLAFDPMGQGERVYYPNATFSRTRLSSSDDEHTTPGRQMLLTGMTCTRMQVWDAIRSLDYLAAHPLVDPARIASTGQSGGGTLTMLLAAADDRLAAAAVAMGNTENFACAGFNPPGSTDDAEQNLIGGGPLGFDRWDLLYPMAPKPLLIGVSARDFFGTYSPSYLESGRKEYEQLRSVYAKLGQPARIDWQETPLPHGLSYDSRLAIYNWFGRWLKHDSAPVGEEPPVSPEPDRELWVSQSGNIVKSLGGKTPFLLQRETPVERHSRPLDVLLSTSKPKSYPAATIVRRVPSRDVAIEALDIPSDDKVWTPAWLFLPRRDSSPGPVLLLIEPSGRNQRWREGELYQTLAARGVAVCVPDVRGIGDSQPEVGRGAAHYTRSHNDEENYAWASLILGRPLVGQRVTDILATADAVLNHKALTGRRLVLGAQGKMTVPALFAAALEPRVSAVYLSGGLISLRNIVDTENYTHTLANIVPGILQHSDLEQIAASLAPRAVTIAGAVDAAGRLLPEAAIRQQYTGASNAKVLAEAAWSVEALATL